MPLSIFWPVDMTELMMVNVMVNSIIPYTFVIV